jgi:hypothetical protein
MKKIHVLQENIYITSNEEIKEGDWYLCLDNTKCNDSIYKCNEVWLNMEEKQPSYCKKIILTTDQDLIKDGVQSIDDEFLEWFVNNPSCEEVEIVKTAQIRPFGSLYKIIIPKEEQTKCYCGHTNYCDCGPEEPKQETLEETIDRASLLEFPIKEWYRSDDYSREEITAARDGFKRGAKWQENKQDEFAIEFAEWNSHRYKYLNGKGWFNGSYQLEMDIFLSSKELLEIFKKEK